MHACRSTLEDPTPGIPVIYYGTEQGFTARRASMFAAGHGSGGVDHFDPDAPMYRYLQRAIRLRRAHEVLSRGMPRLLAANPAAPGGIAWRMDPVDRDGGVPLLVVFNTADHAALLDNLETGFPPGTVLEPVFSIDGKTQDLAIGWDGRATLVLPPRAGVVWRPTTKTPAATASGAERPTLALLGTDTVGGRAPGLDTVRLVVDGNLETARAFPVAADGTWQGRIRTDSMIDPAVTHRAVAYDPVGNAASSAAEFAIDPDWQLAADVDDPTGDDTGPTGNYTYPSEPGYASHPADIEHVRAWTAGGALRIELTMRSLVSTWNPPNGFDHVAFTLFLQLPARSAGVHAMPLQHAALPDAMHWQYRLRAHGWSNTLFSFAGAGATAEGTVVAPGATLDVDRAARTVTFTIPADAIGNPDSLRGARLHVTTWDQDADYRRLDERAADMQFGGGRPGDPLVMDAATVGLGDARH